MTFVEFSGISNSAASRFNVGFIVITYSTRWSNYWLSGGPSSEVGLRRTKQGKQKWRNRVTLLVPLHLDLRLVQGNHRTSGLISGSLLDLSSRAFHEGLAVVEQGLVDDK